MSTDIERYEEGELVQHAPANLFGTEDPGEIVSKATGIADALKDVLEHKGLIQKIQGREFVKVEGWTLLGTMLGVFPVVQWTKPLLKDGKPNGWEARAEARTLTGAVVGSAEAECTRDENQWSFAPVNRYGKPLQARDDYALRSMAQTRAVSKCLRGPLGFIISLAGYEATPADEMPDDSGAATPSSPPAPAPDASGSGTGSGEGDGSTAAAVRVEPSPDLLMTFGQYKGTRVGDVPHDYLSWLAGDDPGDDVGTEGNPEGREPFVPEDEYGSVLVETAKLVLEMEARRLAIDTLSSALKHAEEHGKLPYGHDDWAGYLRWYLEQYKIDPSTWRNALTPQQIQEVAVHLLDQDIPFEGDKA